jgi:haloalkane dehalogenase
MNAMVQDYQQARAAPKLDPSTHSTDDDASPAWLDREQYPFQPRQFQLESGRMHYVDEGEGDVLLFVHGNPSWSFEYRSLIQRLRPRYRCIAPDHIGFGLSDKPEDPSYLPQFHAANLEALIDALGLRNITLVMQDWGGPIGMAYAVRHPGNVKRIVVSNSWFWSARESRTLRVFSALVGGPLGKFLCRHFNFFPRVLMAASVGDKRRFPRRVHDQYIGPFQNPKSRKGTWVFPRAIIGESQWLDTLWGQRDALARLPALLLWGLKDDAFDDRFLRRWQMAFPSNTTQRYPATGHNVFEELGEDAVEPVATFLEAQA